MSDIGATISHTPGVRGHTRSIWGDESSLRGLLRRLRDEYPDASRDNLEELYKVEYRQEDAFIEEAGHRVFANDYVRM